MTNSADHTYILADSAKLRQSGAVAYLRFQDVYQLITDAGISEEEKSFLSEKGIQILVAQ